MFTFGGVGSKERRDDSADVVEALARFSLAIIYTVVALWDSDRRRKICDIEVEMIGYESCDIVENVKKEQSVSRYHRSNFSGL